MLIDLCVTDYAIADGLEVEFQPGMTALTGETGAGKSILLDALGLALGQRADSGSVRPGAGKAEVHAGFDITHIPAARSWLAAQELAGEEHTVLLRRSISREGRSRAWVNGQPVSLQALRQLGTLLVEIHGQHAHQHLLQKPHQRKLLDTYAGCRELADTVAGSARQLQQLAKRRDELHAQQQAQSAEAKLLQYQLEEIAALELDAGGLQALEQEQALLAGSEARLMASEHALQRIDDEESGALAQLQQALHQLSDTQTPSDQQRAATEMIHSAVIQLQEATSELCADRESAQPDPARLQQLEQQLSAVFDVARKHRVSPAELFAFGDQLQQQLDALLNCDAELEAVTADYQAERARYDEACTALSAKRRRAATRLQKAVNKQLTSLKMAGATFAVALETHDDTDIHAAGAESVAFLIATNPGAEPAPLAKIASGGELSRISLAIQVVTAQTEQTPTLIFDEVDVGIGGATAAIVGQLLHDLGERAQVLCVTHQAQVASQADHHLKVAKQQRRKQVSTAIEALSDEDKIEEIARMMGGVAITDSTRAHAREMLSH